MTCMICATALVFIENAFFSWLFDVAPKAAFVAGVMWVLLRWATKFGNYEARFTRIESDIEALKLDQKEIKSEIHLMNGRLGKVEGQLDMVIDLLKNKK